MNRHFAQSAQANRIALSCVLTESWLTSVMVVWFASGENIFPVKIDYSERLERNESHFVYTPYEMCCIQARVAFFNR